MSCSTTPPSSAGHARTNPSAGSFFTLSREPPLIGSIRCLPSCCPEGTNPAVLPTKSSAGFCISNSAVPRNRPLPLRRQRPLQTILDREPTLGHRKKLPARKSELARALVGSSAQSSSSFRFTAALLANAKAIPRSEEFFQKPPSNLIFELHECARS